MLVLLLLQAAAQESELVWARLVQVLASLAPPGRERELPDVVEPGDLSHPAQFCLTLSSQELEALQWELPEQRVLELGYRQAQPVARP